jgi:hypothetical protein
MSSYSSRTYRSSQLVLKESGSKKFVSIDYSPATINPLQKTNFSHVHDTPPYSTRDEAMAHAEGYVDCLSHFYSNYCGQTYTDKNKDSYTEEHKKMLQDHRNKHYGQDVKVLGDSMDEVLTTLEVAYEAGWSEKLSELKKTM